MASFADGLCTLNGREQLSMLLAILAESELRSFLLNGRRSDVGLVFIYRFDAGHEVYAHGKVFEVCVLPLTKKFVGRRVDALLKERCILTYSTVFPLLSFFISFLSRLGLDL